MNVGRILARELFRPLERRVGFVLVGVIAVEVRLSPCGAWNPIRGFARRESLTLARDLRDQRDRGHNDKRHVHPSSPHTCLHVARSTLHARSYASIMSRGAAAQTCRRARVGRDAREGLPLPRRDETSLSALRAVARLSRLGVAAAAFSRLRGHTCLPALSGARCVDRWVRAGALEFDQACELDMPPQQISAAALGDVSGTRWGCRRGKYSERRGGRCASTRPAATSTRPKPTSYAARWPALQNARRCTTTRRIGTRSSCAAPSTTRNGGALSGIETTWC